MVGFLLAIFGTVIFGVGLFGNGGSEAVLFGLMMAVPSAIWFWWELTGGPGARKNHLEKNIEVKSNEYAVLNNRVANNGIALYVSANRDYNIQEHPAELVYTSATVGGITTGGFHINEAYRTESLGGKTGTYSIYLRRANTNYRLTNIGLQPDMIESASKHPVVSQFLDGDTLRLKHNVAINVPANVREEAMKYNKVGRYDVAAKLLRPYKSARELTREECEAVIAWMSGE